MKHSGSGSHLAQVYLALGSNLGNSLENLTAAVERIAEKTTIERISSVYETEPVGYKEQPLFLNAVLSARTGLEPLALLGFVKGIEDDMGRQESFRNAPRPIDIDILLYNDLVLQTEELTIPHPRMSRRAFVLVPLLEIAPSIVDPLSGRNFSDLRNDVGGWDGVRLVEGLSL